VENWLEQKKYPTEVGELPHLERRPIEEIPNQFRRICEEDDGGSTWVGLDWIGLDWGLGEEGSWFFSPRFVLLSSRQASKDATGRELGPRPCSISSKFRPTVFVLAHLLKPRPSSVFLRIFFIYIFFDHLQSYTTVLKFIRFNHQPPRITATAMGHGG
jgi:hypothetical protein